MVLTIFNEKDGFNMMPVIDHPKKHITTDINTGKNQYLPRAVMPCNHSCAKLEASTSRLGEGIPLEPNNDYMMIDNNIQDRDAGLYFAAPTELVPDPVPYVLPTNTELLLELEVFEDGTRRNPVQADNNFHRRKVLQTYSNLKERGDKTSGEYGAQLKLEADKYLQINGPDIYALIKQEEAMAAAQAVSGSDLTGVGTASALQLSLRRLGKDIEDENKENIARELDIISDSIENIRQIATRLPSSPVNERFKEATKLLSTTDIVVAMEGKPEKDVLLNTFEKVEKGTATEPEIEESTRIIRRNSGEINERLARGEEKERLEDMSIRIQLELGERLFLLDIDKERFTDEERAEYLRISNMLDTGELSDKETREALDTLRAMVDLAEVRQDLPVDVFTGEVRPAIIPANIKTEDDLDTLRYHINTPREIRSYAIHIGQNYNEAFNNLIRDKITFDKFEHNNQFLIETGLAIILNDMGIPLVNEKAIKIFDYFRTTQLVNTVDGFAQLAARLQDNRAVIEKMVKGEQTIPDPIVKKTKLKVPIRR